MLLVLLISFISVFGYETLEQEDALQQLKEGNFDIILDIRNLEDFETLRLENAYHLGSLMRGRHGRHGDRDSSSSSSESSENQEMGHHPEREPPMNGERPPPLEAHARRLHGCEDSRIGVHSMGSSDSSEQIPPTTAEVAQMLAEHGFNNVFDLGDVSIARDHAEISKTSGERTGRCRPECVIRQGPPHGRGHGHHGDGRGRGSGSGRPSGSSYNKGRGKDQGRHNRDSSDETTNSILKYGGITVASIVTVFILFCLYRYCTKPIVEGTFPQNEAMGEGSAPTYVVSVNETGLIEGSPENGSPEGWGTTELPPSFEEVTKAAQDVKNSVLAE